MTRRPTAGTFFCHAAYRQAKNTPTLYGYLYYNGVKIDLINRLGTGGGNTYGYSNPGMNIALNDGGKTGLHNYQANSPVYVGGRLTETWRPDSGGAALAGAGGVYNGVNPNGTWELFLADLSAGSKSKLSGWSLEITAVPEPITWALGIFGSVAGLTALLRRRAAAV